MKDMTGKASLWEEMLEYEKQTQMTEEERHALHEWCHSSNYLEPFSSVYLDVLSGSDSVLVRLNGGYSA